MHRCLRSALKLMVFFAVAAAGREALAQGVTGSAINGTITEDGTAPLVGVSVHVAFGSQVFAAPAHSSIPVHVLPSPVAPALHLQR